MKINDVFAKLADAGFLRPTLRVDQFVFKRAPDHGANKGAVYVTSNGEYLGKILAKEAHIRAKPEVVSRICEIANDPVTEAIKHGHKTGQCAVCGRRLDNAQSVELGIGPICAEKIGAWIPRDDAFIDFDQL